MNYKFLLHPQFENFKDVLINIAEYFAASNESIHKARNELKTAEILHEKVVIKAFKVPHIINQFAYSYLREGKARKSYNNALRLEALEVTTPTPIGCIEFFRFGLLRESYFLARYEPYDFTIREVFHHKVDDIENILKQFAKFTYEIHQKGVWHVDYSLGNILITKTVESYKFSLVDINRMEFKKISPQEGLRNFNKFWAKDENDLIIIAKEYAHLANIDEKMAISIVLSEAKSLEAKVNLKRKLKGQQ